MTDKEKIESLAEMLQECIDNLYGCEVVLFRLNHKDYASSVLEVAERAERVLKST